MKATASTTPRRAGIALAVIGIAALAGYGIGRTSRPVLETSVLESRAEKEPDPGSSAAAGKDAHANPKEDRAKQLARIKARVLELGGTRPVQYDFETDREIAALLDQLSAAELGDFFRETTASSRNTADRLRILEAWALKDGPAAIEGTSIRADEWLFAAQAYQAWASKDSDAALKWLREGELSDYAKQHKPVLRKNFLYELMTTDLEKALEQVPDMDPDEKKFFLTAVAAFAAGDEAKLARVKEFTAGADEGTRGAIETGMIVQMSSQDFKKGFEFIDGLEASAAHKSNLEMSVLRATPKEKLAESMDAWVARNEDGQNIPEPMWEMLGSRLIFYREEMRAWLEDMEPGPVRDAFYQQSVRHFVSGGERDKALRYINLIEDPAQRGTALRTMSRMWMESNATEAKAWQESLPESDRQALQP